MRLRKERVKTELSEIKININFENLIPKQTPEQFKQLEENMVAEGRARNPLVLWRGHGVLIDGHHRLRILKAHPEIKWSVVEQEFADDDEVKEWIIKNALGTRNLTEPQITDLRGRLYRVRQKRHGGNRGTPKDESGRFTASPKKSDLREVRNKVSYQLAEELGVNHSTIENAGNYSDGLDVAESVVPGFKDDVLTGKVKAQKQEIAAMRKQTPDEIKKSVKEIKDRKKKSADREFFSKLKEVYAEASGVTTVHYGLAELIREVDALGDSFVGSLAAIIKRRQSVIDTYDGRDEIDGCIDRIIEKLNDMKRSSK